MLASIPYIERIIEQYNRATEVNFATPGRYDCNKSDSSQQGTVVWITPRLADEVIITGDLHGHRRHFNSIRKMAALDANPRRHLVLQEVCHGGPTYPQNGGCMSHSIPENADSPGFDKTIFTRPLDPAELYERSSVFDLLWGRDFRPENAGAFAKIVDARILITGHEPGSEGYASPNDVQVIVDCCGEKGCYLMLPTDRELSHEEIVERIEWLD